MILGITGLACGGKQVAAEYLKDKYGFELLDFAADSIVAEAKTRGLEPTKMNLSILGDELRKTGGMAVFAKIILKKIKSDKTAITGFRSPEEVDYIRNEYVDDFYLIEIHANPVVRFKRRRPSDPQIEQDFFARDERDIQNKGLGKVIEIADYRIENNNTAEELYAKIDEFMQKAEKGEIA